MAVAIGKIAAMKVTPVTPPRPIDVAAVFPQLAPLARTATRLHPRTGAPTWHDSSIGGPLLWPAEEPWPHCEEPHVVDGINSAQSPADLWLERRIFAASHGRDLTPEERETLERIRPPRTYPVRLAVQAYDGPIAMLPVAQLYVRDVPDLSPPEGKDLLQVLWCPFDHLPRTWQRSSGAPCRCRTRSRAASWGRWSPKRASRRPSSRVRWTAHSRSTCPGPCLPLPPAAHSTA
uniref:Uncharacterized protein n=1 Tax=Streptomyces ambofaciens (strain ATCC 23877 / 3486 / DSM 40053 / JCM 4204 / NBRC 12836 / NRRL B-2516) TaxID=278992 RepID=A3KIH5_STRA7|nr:hypothetical protein SAML0523 [Streptomyces ambofaciens ATCC 23877]